MRRWREESNRCVQRLEPTPDGVALFGRLRTVAVHHDERLRAGLSPEETDQLACLLDRLVANVARPLPTSPRE